MTNYEILQEYEKNKIPVPSYDEWFKIKNLASLSECLQEKNIECLHRENKLKNLLKECRELFVLEKGFMVKCIKEETLSDIIAKINEVLK